MAFELYSRRVKKAICTQCDKEFTTGHGTTVCSDECKKKREKARHERNRLEKAALKPGKKKFCAECKKEFTQSKGASRQIYCSKTCQQDACKKKAKIKMDKERVEVKKAQKLKTDTSIDPIYTRRGKISNGVNHE